MTAKVTFRYSNESNIIAKSLTVTTISNDNFSRQFYYDDFLIHHFKLKKFGIHDTGEILFSFNDANFVIKSQLYSLFEDFDKLVPECDFNTAILAEHAKLITNEFKIVFERIKEIIDTKTFTLSHTICLF